MSQVERLARPSNWSRWAKARTQASWTTSSASLGSVGKTERAARKSFWLYRRIRTSKRSVSPPRTRATTSASGAVQVLGVISLPIESEPAGR